MIRALCAWSWLAATTGTAIMLLPHLPLIVGQAVVNHARKDTK